METRRQDIDSDIFGGAVLEIADLDATADFARFEADYVRRENPIYVVCKVPGDDLHTVHLLEDHGFRFVEFQFRLHGTLGRTWDTSAYDYSYSRVSGDNDLAAVLDIASSTFEHDRISRDPALAKAGRNISGERYRRYLLQSAQRASDAVYKLVNNATGEIVGFSSHRLQDPRTALLLVGGVKNEYKSSGLGAINDYFGLNELRAKGVKSLYTHISGVNYPILNLEVKGIGFRIVSGAVVLRKTYAAHAG